MRTDQDPFDRVVRTAGSAIRVRCRPRGSELRDLTDAVDVVNWFSILPGLLGLIGWLLHRTVFLGRWSVTACSLAPATEPTLRLDRLEKDRAKQTFASLVDWLENGHPLADFDPPA